MCPPKNFCEENPNDFYENLEQTIDNNFYKESNSTEFLTILKRWITMLIKFFCG